MLDLETLSLDLANLLSNPTQEGGSILVAGQALAFWGHYYLDEGLEDLSPLASRDIDFFNRRINNVKKYAQNVRFYLQDHGLELEEDYPNMDDNSFVSGLWQIKNVSSPQKEGVIVDFLNYISGLKDGEVEKYADSIEFDGKSFQVLSPVSCLKTRVHNLLNVYPGQKSDEKIENEEERVKLAIKIVHKHITELHYWGKQGSKQSVKRALQVLEIASSDLGKRLYKEKQISILDAIPQNVFDKRFYENNYKAAAIKMGLPVA